MPYKRRYSSKRRSHRRTSGRSGRKYRRTTFQSRVKRVLLKNTETKYYDFANENVQLYHNTGYSGLAHVGPITFNPWGLIGQGTNRYQRVGDSIVPRGMKVNIWMSNKLDRPNVTYRLVVCVLPRLYAGAAVTSGSIDPAPAMQSGSMGNYLVLPWDKEKGIKVLYDKIIPNITPWGDATGNTQKEKSKVCRLWITRKRSKPIKYDSAGNILNNFIAVYLIPYDAFGSLTTDNIASCSALYRLYFKDP